MEIIKKGIKQEKNKKEFSCKYCGTIFIAEKGEYHNLGQMAYIHDGVQYECTCPVCNKKVYK